MNAHGLIKAVVFIACLGPAAMLSLGLYQDNLGANPVEVLTLETGDWGLRFLLITLSITPLRRIFKWHRLITYRRMFGLYSFFYICLHFSIFLIFEHFFDLQSIIEDIVKRPYITVGFSALVLLIPLAVTSFTALQRKMGRSWNKLHKLVYVIAVLGVVHYWWLVKLDILEPLIYACVLTVLLSIRIYYYKKRKSR